MFSNQDTFSKQLQIQTNQRINEFAVKRDVSNRALLTTLMIEHTLFVS